MAWQINLWARLLDGDHAYEMVKRHLALTTDLWDKGGTYPNMLDAHLLFYSYHQFLNGKTYWSSVRF